MNHYDVIVMGLRQTLQGRWPKGLRSSLNEVPRVATI